MKLIFRKAPLFIATLLLLSTAAAAGTEPGVGVKVEKAIERGVNAGASGVERGAKAAGRGIQRGAQAAASGVKRGAKATGKAARSVARKVDGSPSPSSSPDK